jgi:hypothetical protein
VARGERRIGSPVTKQEAELVISQRRRVPVGDDNAKTMYDIWTRKEEGKEGQSSLI